LYFQTKSEAPMSDQTDREAKLREIAKKKVVYTLPGMDELEVRDVTYRSTGGSDLAVQIYYPARPAGTRVPVVVVPLGYPDPTGGIRTFGPFTSWARLIAASGMAAVLYGSSAPADDVHALLQHLRANAGDLSLDAARIGLLAASGSGAVALATLMRDHQLGCAALLCGYTMDLGTGTAVAEMGRQYGFVDACAGKTVDDLPAGVPLLFVRAGQDKSPGLNDALDDVVVQSLARNLPLTLVNHATGAHGFECDEDSPVSRAIVKQVLAFLRSQLQPVG
jgi:hypothetical protein